MPSRLDQDTPSVSFIFGWFCSLFSFWRMAPTSQLTPPTPPPPQLVRLDLCSVRLSPRCISLPRHIWKLIDFGILFYEWELGGCKWWTGRFIVWAAKLLHNYIGDRKARWLSPQLGKNTASEIRWCLMLFMSQGHAGTPESPSVGSESLFPERPFVA